MPNNYRPVILIGAARSGTKLLRDVIAMHPQVACVPFDINYVWRIGNEALPDDELTVASLTPDIARDIRLEIGKFQCGQPVIVEKTVSNCLRVPYVQQVFPEALFIHLVRDGRDVVESTFRQWTDKPDLRYILRKLRTFPVRKAFGYGLAYAWSLLKKLVFPGKTVATWGPRYKGIDNDVAEKSLLEVCALQWVHSVNRASADLACLPAGRVFNIRYEDFVLNPMHYLHEIADFIGVDKTLFNASTVSATVSPQNIGKGFARLTAAQQAMVLPIINNELIRLNYTKRDQNDA